MTDARLMDADCTHGVTWWECEQCVRIDHDAALSDADRAVLDAAEAIVVGSRVTGLTLSDDTHHRAALVAAVRARREANQ